MHSFFLAMSLSICWRFRLSGVATPGFTRSNDLPGRYMYTTLAPPCLLLCFGISCSWRQKGVVHAQNLQKLLARHSTCIQHMHSDDIAKVSGKSSRMCCSAPFSSKMVFSFKGAVIQAARTVGVFNDRSDGLPSGPLV